MLGRTNTGGGGVGGVLTVTAPAGVTVSVSKDGKVKTKSANAEGLAVFKGLASGTWQLTITDGSQVSTKPVVITADYNTNIAFFMATISITYPVGSVCTCSDGVTTLTAPDTSGVWECIVSNTGTWTVVITDGEERAEETVIISTDGQSESVLLDYTFYLYNKGKEIRAGELKKMSGDAVITRNADNLQITGGNTGSIILFEEKINLGNFSKLFVVGSSSSNSYVDARLKVGVWENTTGNPIASKTGKYDNTAPVEISVKTIDKECYIGFYTQHDSSTTIVEQMWLE